MRAAFLPPLRVLLIRSSSACALLACCLAGDVNAQSASPAALAIRDVAVVDVATGEVHAAMTVVVTGNRLRALGPAASTQVPAGARVIEARGKYLIPGLIDSHVHLFQAWNRNWPDTLAQLGWIVAGGVTTVRDAGATGLEANYVELRAASDSGRIVAPRIRVSAPIWQVQAQSAVRTVTEALSRIPALGVNQVKLRGESRTTALDIIRQAAAAGLGVYGHTTWFPSDSTTENYALAAVRAGISGLSHVSGRYSSDGIIANSGPPITYRSSTAERLRADLRQLSGWLAVNDRWQRTLIDSMVAHGTWLEPTLVVTYHDHEALYGQCNSGYDVAAIQRYYPFHTSVAKASLSRPQVDSVRGICAAINAFIRRFHAAGGMIVAGTDYPPFAPLGVTEEMRLLVAAGLSPFAALQAATINAARALGMATDIGTIETGKLADLVLLNANPLTDIGNVRAIAHVISNGRVIDREQLLARAGTTPPMTSYDDIPEKLDARVVALIARGRDTVVTLTLRTDSTETESDRSGIDNARTPWRIQESRAGLVRVRGPVRFAGTLSRIRFIVRIELADSMDDKH